VVEIYAAGGGEGYTLHDHLQGLLLGTRCTATLQAIHAAFGGKENTNVHTVDCGQGYTRTSTLFNIDLDTSSRPHSFLWKGIQPLTSTLPVVERDTLLSLHC
jgi:ribosomal protein L31